MGVARGEGYRPRVVSVQATKASMSQNVDRERRVPLPLSFATFVHDVQACPIPGVADRVAENTWR